MTITSEFFSFNVWEWFLHSLVLEVNLTYRRLTSFMASFYFIPIVLVPWSRFLLCHTFIISISAFRDQISILIVGCVTMWLWDLHHLWHMMTWYKNDCGSKHCICVLPKTQSNTNTTVITHFGQFLKKFTFFSFQNKNKIIIGRRLIFGKSKLKRILNIEKSSCNFG
jgi:hypothetical protein